jgi:hypothetical protein
MNCSALNAHLFIRNLVESPNCICGITDTVSHFLSLWLFLLSFSFSHFVSSYSLSCDVNLVPPVTILAASNWIFSNLFIYFLKTNIKFYCIYQYFMSINSFFQHRICFSIQPQLSKMHVKEIYVIFIHLFDSEILLIIDLNKKKGKKGWILFVNFTVK